MATRHLCCRSSQVLQISAVGAGRWLDGALHDPTSATSRRVFLLHARSSNPAPLTFTFVCALGQRGKLRNASALPGPIVASGRLSGESAYSRMTGSFKKDAPSAYDTVCKLVTKSAVVAGFAPVPRLRANCGKEPPATRSRMRLARRNWWAVGSSRISIGPGSRSDGSRR